jgi:hypothetical protein
MRPEGARKMSKVQTDIMEALQRATKKIAHVVLEKPVAIMAVEEYPHEGQTTFVTAGLSEHKYSMWRGKTSGYELSLTIASGEQRNWARELSEIAAESIRLIRTGERRPPVECNGVFAPGYPPHFFFCEELSQTPDLVGRQKAGSQYVDWLPAIPISDAELRVHDRSVAELMKVLSRRKDLAVWPRK